MRNIIYTLLFIILSIVFFACSEKSSETNYNPNITSAKDYLRAEDAMYEIVNAYLKGILDTLVIEHCYGYIDNCEVCWYPDDSLMTFGYGSVNRMCQDNKFRRGSFYVKFDGEKWDEGVTGYLQTDQLFVDDSLVEAKMAFTNYGVNSDNLVEYALKVDYCKIKLPDTTKVLPVTISADYIFEWTQGFLTHEIHEDDIYMVTGSATGNSSDGYVFSVDITEPLENHVECYWISKGKGAIIVPAGDYTYADIDYITEDGCANAINLYINDNSFMIS
jgi:hypothetical protein